MTEKWENFVMEETIVEKGLRVVSLPTPDYSAPSIDSIIKAVKCIEECVSGYYISTYRWLLLILFYSVQQTYCVPVIMY